MNKFKRPAGMSDETARLVQRGLEQAAAGQFGPPPEGWEQGDAADFLQMTDDERKQLDEKTKK